MNKTMKGFSLKQHMARRRQAAAVARQRMNEPHFAKRWWLERKLQFDRQFRILMSVYSGQNTTHRITKAALVIIVLSIIISIAVAVVNSTLVAKQAAHDAARIESALVHCLNGGELDVGDGVRVVCVAAK